MRTFREFTTLCEQSKFDKERSNLSVGTRAPDPSRGGRVGADRKKSAPEKTRMKAVGGGKMVPAKDYKARKDIGKQRQASTRVQQPTSERGSAREKQLAAAKAERRKAAQARIAQKKGKVTVLPSQATSKPKTKSKDLERKASQMLTKKKKQTVDPNYKPQKASGYTRAERRAIKRQGQKLSRDLGKGIDRPASYYAVKLGGK
tara:strand:- start:19 stop:627 length:609 start_codon:yes stop_codon:yes gene_type:complete